MSSPKKSRKTPHSPRKPPEKPTQDRALSISQLEQWLWSAADILRGSIDAADYKQYIFGLLFLKRLSDQFEEEYNQRANKANTDPNDRNGYDFFVPVQARFPVIAERAKSSPPALVLNEACAALEEANPSLKGVLAGIDFNDENKLGDEKNRKNLLGSLIAHFERKSLSNAHLTEPDMLGRAYEYLIEKFADDAGKKGGEFYTPRMVARLLVNILRPGEHMRICDPTCGSGGMLIECAHYLERHGKNASLLHLFGQEKNAGTWAICRMNMLLHGLRDARIEKGDTIRDPKLVENGALMQFDRVIANPPFSLDAWGREFALSDPYKRFEYGVPSNIRGDFAFIQHMAATLAPNGMAAVVVPHGILFRSQAEAPIRKKMIEHDWIEAVIGLAPNLFYTTGIRAAIIVLNPGRPAARKNKILMIGASADCQTGTAQNILRTEDVDKIANAYHAFEDIPGYARVVSLEEIAANDYTLSLSIYLPTAAAGESSDLGTLLSELESLSKRRTAAEKEMHGFIQEFLRGLNPEEMGPDSPPRKSGKPTGTP